MLETFRKFFPDSHPVRLFFHKIKGFLAAVLYWYPAEKMIVIGVTGTNGKTTTTNLIANILSGAGHKIGMASTINFQVGDERWTNVTKQTTASPFFLQKLLRRMVNEGCKYLVLEVSSHAMIQSRVYGINFDVAVVTNLTPEHIDYHGDFESYREAKGRLFRAVASGVRKTGVQKVTVMNADDKEYNYFNQFVADRKMTYGFKGATIFADQIEKKPEGSRFILNVPNDKVEVNLSLPGEFNVYNSLAAATACLSLNISLVDIKKGLEASSSIPGRFEHVDVGQPFSVIVDYAHTADALENLFRLYRSLTPGRLFAVFGATGGGRDKGKRPKMGAAVNEFADFIIVTDDDPYDEGEWDIIEQVSEGIPRKEGQGFWKIADRFEAIRLALTLAREGDSVVIAGKGAEEIMMLDGKKIPWNDKKIVTDLLKRNVQVSLDTEESEFVKKIAS